MINKGKLAAIRRIIRDLEKDLAVAQDEFQPEGHDNKEALLVSLEKALTTARNVARSYGEKD